MIDSMEVLEYLQSKNKGNYDRDNYDSFLKKRRFSFNVPSIHITGTNGKGSTATYLASILKHAGYKTALYHSPYSRSPREMIQINGEQISEEKFNKMVLDNQKDFDKADLSEFEIETYIALTYFQEQKCDVAIIECGMGGEIDATNVFDPVLSIITSISLEHTAYLGKSVTEIAESKGGIIKPRVPVLIGNTIKGDALDVLTSIARDNKTKITTLNDYAFEKLVDDGYTFFYGGFYDLKVPTKATYSVKDACFAVEAIALLSDKFNVSETAIREGLLSTKLKGRMEFKMNNPLVIVDGAHNPEAIQTLIADMDKIQENKPIHAVFVAFRDKNVSNMLSDLSVLAHEITLTTFDHPRARREDEYFLYLDEFKFEEDHKQLIQRLIDEYPDDIILVTGSLAFAFLVSEEFDENVYLKKWYFWFIHN